MCSSVYFEVYKGKYTGDIFGHDDKGPLIDKCIMKTKCYGLTHSAENTSDEWIMYFNGSIGSVCIRKWIMGGDITTVEEFFKITKIEFKDII